MPKSSEIQRIRDLLPDDLFPGSKDWITCPLPEARIEWLLSMYRSKSEEVDVWVNAINKIGERYDKVRKMNPKQFWDIWERNLIGEGSFDELLDKVR